jgi:ATPase subunit of ABC transporter with duplicated ATPase domains
VEERYLGGLITPSPGFESRPRKNFRGEGIIKPFFRRREALSIVGPRQCGKTTFLQHIRGEIKKTGETVKFLTFEKRNGLEFFNQSIDDFKKFWGPGHDSLQKKRKCDKNF